MSDPVYDNTLYYQCKICGGDTECSKSEEHICKEPKKSNITTKVETWKESLRNLKTQQDRLILAINNSLSKYYKDELCIDILNSISFSKTDKDSIIKELEKYLEKNKFPERTTHSLEYDLLGILKEEGYLHEVARETLKGQYTIFIDITKRGEKNLEWKQKLNASRALPT